jgi:hypothetical protein
VSIPIDVILKLYHKKFFLQRIGHVIRIGKNAFCCYFFFCGQSTGAAESHVGADPEGASGAPAYLQKKLRN